MEASGENQQGTGLTEDGQGKEIPGCIRDPCNPRFKWIGIKRTPEMEFPRAKSRSREAERAVHHGWHGSHGWEPRPTVSASQSSLCAHALRVVYYADLLDCITRSYSLFPCRTQRRSELRCETRGKITAIASRKWSISSGKLVGRCELKATTTFSPGQEFRSC